VTDYSAARRRTLAKKGQAIPSKDGPPKFPITDRKSLSSAIRLAGHAKGVSQATVRGHIKRQAVRLKLTHMIPDTWK
jgi:hypothetical protein